MRSRREIVCFSFVPYFPVPSENKENIVVPFGLDWLRTVQPIFYSLQAPLQEHVISPSLCVQRNHQVPCLCAS